MKYINSKQFWILKLLLLGFIILQILDFPKPSNYPWLFGTGKFLILIFVPIYIFRFDKKLTTRICIAIIYFTLIISIYSIPFWKIKAGIYLSNIQEEYSEVVRVLEPKGSFGFIIYKKHLDSLLVRPESLRSQFTPDEITQIQNFLKEHYYVEIHKERNGIALIYRRFLDNRSGFILCQDQECRAKMDSTDLNNETYKYFNEDWYHFSAR